MPTKIKAIKESHELKTLCISTLFENLIEHGHVLKMLKETEANLKNKEKEKEEKRSIFLKTLTSKVVVNDDEDSSNRYTS